MCTRSGVVLPIAQLVYLRAGKKTKVYKKAAEIKLWRGEPASCNSCSAIACNFIFINDFTLKAAQVQK